MWHLPKPLPQVTWAGGAAIKNLRKSLSKGTASVTTGLRRSHESREVGSGGSIFPFTFWVLYNYGFSITQIAGEISFLFSFFLIEEHTVKWSLCHTCDSHQKCIDGLIIWRTCEERQTQNNHVRSAVRVPPPNSTHRPGPGSPWPHRSLPGTTGAYSSITTSPNFYL